MLACLLGRKYRTPAECLAANAFSIDGEEVKKILGKYFVMYNNCKQNKNNDTRRLFAISFVNAHK